MPFLKFNQKGICVENQKQEKDFLQGKVEKTFDLKQFRIHYFYSKEEDLSNFFKELNLEFKLYEKKTKSIFASASALILEDFNNICDTNSFYKKTFLLSFMTSQNTMFFLKVN